MEHWYHGLMKTTKVLGTFLTHGSLHNNMFHRYLLRCYPLVLTLTVYRVFRLASTFAPIRLSSYPTERNPTNMLRLSIKWFQCRLNAAVSFRNKSRTAYMTNAPPPIVVAAPSESIWTRAAVLLALLDLLLVWNTLAWHGLTPLPSN